MEAGRSLDACTSGARVAWSFRGSGTQFPGRPWRAIVLLALAYVAGAVLGMCFLFDRWSATLWPPAGISLAAAFLWGTRLWPGIALGSLLVNGSELVARGVPPFPAASTAVCIALGNVLQALAGAWLVRRVASGQPVLERTRTVLWFVGGGAIASSVLGASLATIALGALGSVSPADCPTVWLHWWWGNASGILICAPLILAWCESQTSSSRRSPWEGAALIAAVAALGGLVFGWEIDTNLGHYPLVYLPMPLLGWSALRCGVHVTVLANAVLTMIAIASTLRARGPFVLGTAQESLFLLQTFSGVAGITSLLISSVVSERERGAATLRQTQQTLEDRVAQRTSELRALSERLQTIREEERQRIAGELHDEVGQQLTALNMDIVWLASRLPGDDPRLKDRGRAMRDSIDSVLRVVRRIATELRPSVLDNLGLLEAIDWQVVEFSERYGIDCSMTVDGAGFELPQACSTDVFRVIQEALTNVARHAEATTVWLRIRVVHDWLIIHIDDNGRGIDEQRVRHGSSLGLLSMRERIARWGGHLDIIGRVGVGTAVRIEVPLPRRSQASRTEAT